MKQLASLEMQWWINALYRYRKYVKIMSIQLLIYHDQFEQTVCKVLQHISVEIIGKGIESCHCLNKKSNQTIVKFYRNFLFFS